VDTKKKKRVVEKEIVAKEVSELVVPMKREWGPSVSINETHGPHKYNEKEQILKIEMQTGDVISIIANSIQIEEIKGVGVN